MSKTTQTPNASSDAELVAAAVLLAKRWVREARAEQYGAISSTKMECARELEALVSGAPESKASARRQSKTRT